MVDDTMTLLAELDNVKEVLHKHKALIASYRKTVNEIVDFSEELQHNKTVPGTETVRIDYVIERLLDALGVNE